MNRTIILALAFIFQKNAFIYAFTEEKIRSDASSYQVSGGLGYAFYNSKNIQGQFQRRTVCSASVPCADYNKLFPHKPYYQLEALYRWKSVGGVGIKLFSDGASESIRGLKDINHSYVDYSCDQKISCLQLGLYFDTPLLDVKSDYNCYLNIGFGYQQFSNEIKEKYSSPTARPRTVYDKESYNSGYIEPGAKLTYRWGLMSFGINFSYSYCLDDYMSMNWNGTRLGAVVGVLL